MKTDHSKSSTIQITSTTYPHFYHAAKCSGGGGGSCTGCAACGGSCACGGQCGTGRCQK